MGGKMKPVSDQGGTGLPAGAGSESVWLSRGRAGKLASRALYLAPSGRARRGGARTELARPSCRSRACQLGLPETDGPTGSSRLAPRSPPTVP